MIYELDYDDRKNQLETQIADLKNVNNSFSDNRQAFRIFARENELDFSSLEKCIKMFERSVLIDAYTLSEQLIKNMYYELVDKSKHDNQRLNTFIDMKINPKTFSPNVRLDSIEKGIRSDLIPFFKLVYRKDEEESKDYDHMVDARHTYAHRGAFTFELDTLENVVMIIDYLYHECKMLIEESDDYRKEYQDRLKSITQNLIKLEKSIDNYRKRDNDKNKETVKNDLKSMKDICSVVVNYYGEVLSACDLLMPIYNALSALKSIDLRKSVDVNIDEFENQKQALKRLI